VLDRLIYDSLARLPLLAATAGMTSRVRIGTSILLATLWSPLLLAKELATIDQLSEGRLIVGMAVGAREPDFQAAGVSIRARGRRLEETMALLKQAWGGGPVDHAGRAFPDPGAPHGPPAGAATEPAPVAGWACPREGAVSGRAEQADAAAEMGTGRLIGPIARVLVLFAGFASPALALDTPNERVTLAGLTGVHVVVNEMSAEAAREGLTRSSLQAEVESRLRRGGLRVLTAAEALTSVGRPTLELRVTLIPAGEVPQLYVYSVDLALRQQIRLTRDRSVDSFAITWSETRQVGVVGATRLAVVRDAVRAKVEEFITAWQTVNPER
jgi:alkanesulfonate monooxygenase SsuD/methylene tetrahydromethanopterin reductase-like flavin-dependent oxidoreductase (luciferase family)